MEPNKILEVAYLRIFFCVQMTDIAVCRKWHRCGGLEIHTALNIAMFVPTGSLRIPELSGIPAE
jgi:hypothetical protein